MNTHIRADLRIQRARLIKAREGLIDILDEPFLFDTVFVKADIIAARWAIDKAILEIDDLITRQIKNPSF